MDIIAISNYIILDIIVITKCLVHTSSWGAWLPHVLGKHLGILVVKWIWKSSLKVNNAKGMSFYWEDHLLAATLEE